MLETGRERFRVARAKYNVQRVKEALAWLAAFLAWFRDVRAWKRPWCAVRVCVDSFYAAGRRGDACRTQRSHKAPNQLTRSHRSRNHIHNHNSLNPTQSKNRYNVASVFAAYFVCFWTREALLLSLLWRSFVALRRLLKQVMTRWG